MRRIVAPKHYSSRTNRHKGQQGMAEYQANLDVIREKTARLRALRLARDATNKKTPLPTTKGAT
jgi:hypothetical protein